MWGADRAGQLAELATAAMPAEGLSADELLACCWEDPGVVLATPDGTGAIAATVRRWDTLAIGYVKLVAVHPGARRQGVGRALLEAAEQWVRDEGSKELHLGGSAPFYLWPGIDVMALPMLCLAEACGYEEAGAALNMSVPTLFRSPAPEGISVERVLDQDLVDRTEKLIAPIWPEWLAETRRAVEQGTCLAAVDAGSGTVAGFACHSVNRAGWFGPTGTDPAYRHRGIGRCLLGEVGKDLMVAGYGDIEISWLGPLGFYASAGGAVSRVFQARRKRLTPR